MNPHQKNKVDIAVSSPHQLPRHHTTIQDTAFKLSLTTPSSIPQPISLSNPHSDVILQSLSPDEQRLFRLYGKLPSKSDHLAKHLKERKYFDSGDYALSKAGKASSVDTGSVGSEHPLPENIPHLSSPGISGVQGGSGNGNVSMGGAGQGVAGSPVKESSYLHRETSIDEVEQERRDAATKVAQEQNATTGGQEAISPPAQVEGMPIRRP